MICPEVAENKQFFPRKSNFFKNCLQISIFSRNLPEKIAISQKFAWKYPNLFVKLPEKIIISRKFAWKIEIFLTRIHDPPDFRPD